MDLRARFGAHVRSHGVAYLALFVALGGTSYAAIKLPANSVGSKQLRNGAVTAKKIKASTRRALRGQVGPQGPIGPQGAPGANGAAGPPGPGAVRFALERTADPASPNAPHYPLASAYGVTLTAPCVVSVGDQVSTTLEVDPAHTGTITASFMRQSSGTSPNFATVSAQVLAADPPYTFFGYLTSDNDAAATVNAGFDDGTTTVLISAFVDLDNSTKRCHVYGALWPGT